MKVSITDLNKSNNFSTFPGSKTITDRDGKEWDYQGNIDEDGKACGLGISTRLDGENHDLSYEGYFNND